MFRTRSQLENLSKEELSEELLSAEDLPSKISYLTSHFNEFLRKYEIFFSEVSVTKYCNHMLS